MIVNIVKPREGIRAAAGARIQDARLGRWMSVEPLQKKYPGLSTYCFANNNPILFVDVDGRDWFVNNRTGQVIYVKKASTVSSELISKIGTGGNPNDYERLGPNEMFGNKVIMAGANMLKQNIAIIEASELFMSSRGYSKADKVNIVEKDITVTVGDDATSFQTLDQIGDSKITYVKPEKLNTKENVLETKFKDENINLTTISYTLTKPTGQKNEATAIFPQNRPSNDSIWSFVKQAVSMLVDSYFDKKSSSGGRAPAQPSQPKAAGR